MYHTGSTPEPASRRAAASLCTCAAALHEVAVSDRLGEDGSVRERVIRADLEDTDVRVLRVVEVEERLVRREAEAVRLAEVVDEQLELAAARGDPVNALEVEFLVA